MLTPKCLTNLIVTRYAVRKGVTPKEYYVDNRVRKGCSIGLLAKGLTLENTEGATFFQRAVSAGSNEAVPCWLYAKMMQGVFPTDKDLTVERKVLLADHPLWNLVSALSELKEPVQREQYRHFPFYFASELGSRWNSGSRIFVCHAENASAGKF